MNKILIRVGAVFATAAVIAAGVFGTMALTHKSFEVETIYCPVGVTGSGVIDEFGNELVSGETYAMPMSVVYNATTAESKTASDGITLTVKVTPDNAADKRVDYTVAWKNASSTWARNKNATDYVTITPQSDGSTISTLKCLHEFGEQVIITAISRQNPQIKATCQVDFQRRITGISVKFGDNEIFGDGDYKTNFYLTNNSNAGGVVSASYQTSETYTKDCSFFGGTVTLQDTTNWKYNGSKISDEYPVLQTKDTVIAYELNESENMIGKSIYFDRRLLELCKFRLPLHSDPMLYALEDDPLEQILRYTDWSTHRFFTLVYTIQSSYGVITYSKNVCGMGYTVPPVIVSEMSFETPNVVV